MSCNVMGFVRNAVNVVRKFAPLGAFKIEITIWRRTCFVLYYYNQNKILLSQHCITPNTFHLRLWCVKLQMVDENGTARNACVARVLGAAVWYAYKWVFVVLILVAFLTQSQKVVCRHRRITKNGLRRTYICLTVYSLKCLQQVVVWEWNQKLSSSHLNENVLKDLHN